MAKTFVFSYIHFGVMITYVYLAAYVLIKSPKTAINRSCFALAMCFALWSMLMAVLQNPAISVDTARRMQVIGAVGWIGFLPAFLVFSLLLTDRAHLMRRPLVLALLVIPPLFLYVLQLGDLLVARYVPVYYGWAFVWYPGLWTWVLSFYYFAAFCTGTLLLYSYSRKTTNPSKRRLARVTVINALVVIVLASFSNMLLPMAGVLKVPAMADVLGLFWVFFLARLMERNRALVLSPAMAADDILEAMSDCLVLLTTDGQIAAANPAARRLLRDGEELFGLPACEAFPENLCSEILSGRALQNREVRLPGRNGDGSFLLLSTSELKNEEGETAGVICLAKDITEQKNMEQVKNQMEQSLIRIQRLESLGNLAGGIAHNFNNLLMGIQGNASLALLSQGIDEKVQSRLQKIQALVADGAELTGNLLGYARKGRYEPRPLAVNQLVVQSSAAFEATARNISVVRDLAPELPRVKADRAQLDQVLFNLYVNASEAMPEGGELFLTTSPATEKDIVQAAEPVTPGPYARITVRDTGAGMAPEALKHAFEPFFTTKGLSRGTGLGLSSAYGIIRGHGGHIQIFSQQGGGTTFDIFLPADAEEPGPHVVNSPG